MDVYYKDDYINEKKPVLLFIHGGAFFFGDKEDKLQRELTDNALKQGFVVVSVNYRLGSMLLGTGCIEKTIYCGVQDVRSALRYITHHCDDFRIDPDRIFIAGSSSGAFIALTTAFMEEHEIYKSCHKKSFRKRFGNLDNSGNDLDCPFKIAGVISLWGGIPNLDIISEHEKIPVLLFHGTEDNIILQDHGIPFQGQIPPVLRSTFLRKWNIYGSHAIYEHITKNNIPAQIIYFEGNGHEPYLEKDGSFNDNLDVIKEKINDFLLMNTTGQFINDLAYRKDI